MSKRSDKLKALLLYQQLNWHKISALIENMVKYSILTIQQLKVVAASSTKTVLWNAWVWRISNYGDYSPLWYNLWCGGCLCLAFHLLFKSCSTYCGTWGVAYKKSLEKFYKKQYFHQAAFYCLLLTLQYLKKMHMKTTPKSR